MRVSLVGPAALFVLLAALVGCTSSEAGAGVKAVPTGPATSASASALAPTVTPSPSGSAAALGAVLESIALKDADLANGYTLHLIDGGDQVTGQVTLDNCGFAFTSETHRVARRQYSVVDSTGVDSGASTELVAYDSAASATLALGQWYQAAATCPKTPVKSAVQGVPDLTIAVTSNQLNVASLPVPTNALTVESATAQGQTLYEVTVIEAHGQFLDILYDTADSPPDQNEMSAVLSLAGVTGARLAAVK